MEVIMKSSLLEKFKNLAFKEKSYFLQRREINWNSIVKCGLVALIIGMVGILLIPAQEEPVGEFQSAEGRAPVPAPEPVLDSYSQIGGGFARSVPENLEHLYAPSPGGGSAPSGDERSSSMILARGGLDARTQLPMGTRISVRFYEKAIVGAQGMPVIGLVTRDYVHEDAVAIPQGSKLFGDVTFDDGGDRASVSWKSVQLPDGRERPLSAIGVGTDGQVGVSGRVHSEALKNAVGQTLTRFVGAYAEGSMQRGAMGGNPGGHENGMKNAVAETAKDQAEAWANDLKKEKRWIEISNSTEFFAVLTASFTFRDPGSTYGR